MRHQPPPAIPALTATDLEFVVSEAAPEASDRGRLAQLVAEDEAFRAALLGDDRLVERVLTDEETFLRISPTLYFEVLLRRALKEMEAASHTVERSGRQSIPVFDAGEVVELIARPGVLYYLAEMLASFTRIRSHVVPVRGRKGVRRRVRYNDLDIDSLISLCATADEDHRFDFYRRIADVCLFTTGLFPEHAHPDRQASPSGQTRAPRVRRGRRSLEEYEDAGRWFYGQAHQHPRARIMQLSDVFVLLREHFTVARKPLSFIAAHYLHSHRRHPFGSLAEQRAL